jgi:hypothetical protein
VGNDLPDLNHLDLAFLTFLFCESIDIRIVIFNIKVLRIKLDLAVNIIEKRINFQVCFAIEKPIINPLNGSFAVFALKNNLFRQIKEFYERVI